MSGMLMTDNGAKPEWIRPVHTVRVWIPCEPLMKSEGQADS